MHVQQTDLLRKYVGKVVFACGLLAVQIPVAAQAPVGNASPGSDLQVDPVTGDIYRRVTRTVSRPVVDERIERQEKVVYRPETVKETRPEFRTSYLPVTEMKWLPYVQNRWNPFRQPTVEYRQVPETRWEARSEVINRTTTQTRWVPETRTVEIPHRTVRYETRQESDVELVARSMPTPTIRSNIDPAIVARLQPINGAGGQSFGGQSFGGQPAASVASNRYEPQSQRSESQSGIRPKVLTPASGYSSAPSNGIYR